MKHDKIKVIAIDGQPWGRPVDPYEDYQDLTAFQFQPETLASTYPFPGATIGDVIERDRVEVVWQVKRSSEADWEYTDDEDYLSEMGYTLRQIYRLKSQPDDKPQTDKNMEHELSGAELILEKRLNHTTKHNYSEDHDRKHSPMEFINAAKAYMYSHIYSWPWDRESFKLDNQIENLVNAGSMLAAAIDVLKLHSTQPDTKVEQPEGFVIGYKCKLCGTEDRFGEFPVDTYITELGTEFDTLCKNPECEGQNKDLEEIIQYQSEKHSETVEELSRKEMFLQADNRSYNPDADRLDVDRCAFIDGWTACFNWQKQQEGK